MSTIWSVIVNRKDALGQAFWTEWRNMIVSVSTGAADAGAIPMLDANGQIDPSMIPPGLGGNYVQTLVDFGPSDSDLAQTTVTGQTWVTANSIIVCGPAAIQSPDHSPEEYALEGIVAYATNLVPGVGFDVIAKACGDSGTTYGKYYINATGR